MDPIVSGNLSNGNATWATDGDERGDVNGTGSGVRDSAFVGVGDGPGGLGDAPCENEAPGGSSVIHYDVNDPDLTSNRENPDEEDEEEDGNDGDKPHNRSHDSIESQRTIIEADDFSSFLAQDDDDDDDFEDEDINDDDLGIRDSEDFDISALMSSGRNPYMLDFTSSSMLGESEVEGNDEDEDGTLSGRSRGEDGDSTPRGGDKKDTPPKRKGRRKLRDDADRGVWKARSWVKASAPYHGPQGQFRDPENVYYDYSDDDSDGEESPPRNFREEINNNVQKPSFIPPLLTSSSLASTVPPMGGASSHPHLHGNLLPSKPTTPMSKSMRDMQQQQQQHQSHVPTSDLAANLSPRYAQQQLQHYHQQQQHPQQQPPASPSSKVPPRFQAYEFETPLRTRTSGSMENLLHDDTPSPPPSHFLDDEQDANIYWKQRRNSAPNLYESMDQIPLCRNCQFSRDDYLFKIRLLQTQLEKTEKELKKKEVQWQHELIDLKKENEKQQKIISQSLALGPEARIEATMQHEITRLTSENLDLRESIDKQMDQMRKLKKMLKVYAKKLKDGEAAEIAAELENEENASSNTNLATVIHRERAYMGMLEYKKEDESALIKNLLLDLKPKLAAGLIPGLPAYIMFMCVRHTDYINDDDKVKTLLTSTINGIKKVVKRHSDDLERITMWLANTCRLLHTLKQYSGDKQFQAENSPKQNEQCLRNFDLSEYRQVFSDLAVWNYQALMKLMEELIQPNIVPAILEHEAIAGLTASKPSGLRGRASSNAKELDNESSHHSLDSLMRTLNSYMRIVKQHAVDPELVKQIFRQLFYFMCAGALNNLLLRKDMCNWSKGMQIRYNLSHLEQWLRDNSLHEFGALAALDPIIQASQLLQARKTDSDVDSVCDMCSKLTTAQIVKILNIYTPVDDFEERVPIAFIRKIQAKLKKRSEEGSASTTLLMDTKYSYPVTFPFNPSSVALETTAVPEQLHLGFLVRH